MTSEIFSERIGSPFSVLFKAPKLAPHVEAIRARLAETLEIDMGCISVKATTSEGLGFTGRGEGIAVFATVLVSRAS